MEDRGYIPADSVNGGNYSCHKYVVASVILAPSYISNYERE
jgi:hypothetical protein